MDWGSPYGCEEWIKRFDLKFPILDDHKGKSIYNKFGNGVVPFNVIIDKNNRLVYAQSGFNKDEIIKTIKMSLKNSNNYDKNASTMRMENEKKTNYERLRENKGFN